MVSRPLIDHLPQLGQMISALESENHDQVYTLAAELEQTYGFLYQTYADELQYLAADEPQNDIAEEIGEQFSEIQAFLAALSEDLQAEDFVSALETLQELSEEATTLYSLFDDYTRESQEGPRYSKIPYAHELIRVAKHYQRGALSIEAVQGRFEVFCQYHEALEYQISTAIPSTPEKATFEESAEDLEEALGMQMQGIEELDAALDAADPEAVSEALEIIAEAAEVLVEIYHTLQVADLEPDTIFCIRCGASNSTDNRICGECNAVLPQSTAQSPTSTMAFEEDGSAIGTQESEEILRLQAGVDGCIHGGDVEPLTENLVKYQERLERIEKRFKALDNPPSDIPEQHLALLQRAKSVFGEAMIELESGLECLNQGARDLDPFALDSGMEKMRAGNALFVEFLQDFSEAEKLSSDQQSTER